MFVIYLWFDEWHGHFVSKQREGLVPEGDILKHHESIWMVPTLENFERLS